MPEYRYEHPETGQFKDVFQSMTEPHEYAEEGVQWKRVWNTVGAAENTQIDPFSQLAFIEKTGKAKGSLGDVWERSAELSAKRAEKRDGTDPVKEKYYKDYSATRHGAIHQQQAKEYLDKVRIEI